MSWLDDVGRLSGERASAFNTEGTGRIAAGVESYAPALDYLTKLVHGDQAELTEAAQPQIDQIGQQFDQIRNLVSMQPRGGGKASALAESPFEKSAAIQRATSGMRFGAASQLGNLGSSLAGLGVSEAGIGQGYAGMEAEAAARHKNKFQQIMEGIDSVTGIVGDVAGLGGALKFLGGKGRGGSGGNSVDTSSMFSYLI